MESPSLRQADIQPTGAIGFAARNHILRASIHLRAVWPQHQRRAALPKLSSLFEFTGVDFDPIGIYVCSCFVLSRMPSIAAFEERAGRGARQWHRDGAPGGAGSYVTGPARPKAATPGNRGPAVARAEPRIWVRHPRRSAGGASRRSIPLLGKRKKGKRRADPGARIQSQGSRNHGRMQRREE